MSTSEKAKGLRAKFKRRNAAEDVALFSGEQSPVSLPTHGRISEFRPSDSD